MKLLSKLHAPCMGMFILRLVIGGIFIYSGYYKLTNMGMTVAGFETMGFGAFWAWAVALIEFIGGIAVVAGVFTKISGLLLSIIMIVAIVKVHLAGGFASVQGPLTILAGTIAITLCNCGSWNLKKACGMCNHDKGQVCKSC
jgi:putative oxidoreductase